ncbi:hypothetical protein MC885_010355 [Smutsia gigantea]|nr:hypothetical protein MC885_010355 [Smutsia gigantea]
MQTMTLSAFLLDSESPPGS